MDFNDTPEEAAFRKEVRAWLDANATRKSDDKASFRARNDDPELLKKHLGDPVPHVERATIGHDPETDVHVLVHGRAKGGKSSVHDHGPCWVVYGNYQNPTRMRRWRRLDDGSRPGHAELTMQREFMNEPGHAAAFAVGDIHSIEFGDDTFFLRVTGGDVETKETHRFDVDKKTVEIANRALGQR